MSFSDSAKSAKQLYAVVYEKAAEVHSWMMELLMAVSRPQRNYKVKAVLTASEEDVKCGSMN